MDNSKNSINNDKSLCLYCDKAFSNINDQGNHVEREHKTVLNKSKGSLRKSERITKNLCFENSPFAACFYCNNKKLIKSDDLESLFQHLLVAHKDIYFGCKCKTRLYDKVSLANHKKNCELGGGIDDGGSNIADEKISEKRKSSSKTSQSKGSNNDLKCDNLLENNSTICATPAAANNHSVKILPTNAINKKSDRSNVKNSNNKNVVNSNEKRNNISNKKKSKISNLSSSSSTISSSSSNKTSDDYTIPLTRQKLKEPTASPSKQKNNRTLLSANESSKNASTPNASSSTSSSASSPTKVQRTKTTKVISHNLQNNCELVENIQRNDLMLSTEFDEDFYKNISYNIRVNLNSFIDGKIDRLQLSRPVFDRISANENTTGGKQPNEIPTNHDEKEIHEATNFELSTPFPALLTAEQYGFGDSNPKNKRYITKNSWKWKWDLIKKYKYVNEGGKIVKKVKQITTGLKDLSQLDMWTQLSMRSRYENLNNQNGSTEFDDGLNDSLSTRMIKTQNIEQLNTILDRRLVPEINVEQLQQTLVKEELIEPEENDNEIYENDDESNTAQSDLLSMFQLAKTDTNNYKDPALSGEWARPRRFVCIDCGQEFDLMKSLTDHKNSEHPYVVSTHYEVVGRENLEQKLYKNLFLPKKALYAKGYATSKSLSINSDSKSNEASISSYNSSNLSDQKEKECSKCMKTFKYSNDIDIYRHILDCIEDRVWMQAKRRNKYRRSRRKTKKNVRKAKLPNDQKKSTSSPFSKELIEADNSLSNPPTPKEDKKSIATKGKQETYVSDPKANSDGMNIKSFFRVSKTTPNLPQKIVVQMIEMPQNNTLNTSLRQSLRSSAKKISTSNQNINMISTEVENNPTSSKESDEAENDSNTVKEETITEEPKNIVENSSLNTNNLLAINHTIKTDIPPALTALQIPDTDKIKSLTSPTNSSSSSLVSPTSSVPKKKKKLNDCIAMLTCKIQEKLGVNFFESSANEIFPSDNIPKKQEENISAIVTPLPMPSLPIFTQNKIPDVKTTPPITRTEVIKIPDVPQPVFSLPEQDEVIDLSIKRKPSVELLPIPDQSNKPTDLTIMSENVIISIENNSISKCDDIKQESTSMSEVKSIENPPNNLEKCNQNDEKSQDTKIVEKTIVNESESSNNESKTEPELINIVDITESFKISIEKKRINNLNEILQNNSVITVNNLTISELERRAFEEQKNRIMQILNKTKKTTNKKPAKKAPPKKSPAKKNNKQPQSLKEAPVTTVNSNDQQEAKLDCDLSQDSQSKTEEPKSDAVKDANKEEDPENIEQPPKVTIEPPKVAIEPPKATTELSKSKKETLKTKSEPSKPKNEPPKSKDESSKGKIEPSKAKVLKNSTELPKVTTEPLNPTVQLPQITIELSKLPIETPKVSSIVQPVKPAKVMYKFPGAESPKRNDEEKATDIKEKFPESTINKIEQAIKTTNRIRCRRLSVVVDPLIHLSPFTQSNRKIRLTNNSQQNGFYDLLTNDQLFNAIKPQLKDEIKKTCAKVGTKAAKNIQSAINEVRAALNESAKNKEQKKDKVVPKSAKSKPNTKTAKKKTAAKKSKSKKNTKNTRAQAKKQLEKQVEATLNNKKSTRSTRLELKTMEEAAKLQSLSLQEEPEKSQSIQEKSTKLQKIEEKSIEPPLFSEEPIKLEIVPEDPQPKTKATSQSTIESSSVKSSRVKSETSKVKAPVTPQKAVKEQVKAAQVTPQKAVKEQVKVVQKESEAKVKEIEAESVQSKTKILLPIVSAPPPRAASLKQRFAASLLTKSAPSKPSITLAKESPTRSSTPTSKAGKQTAKISAPVLKVLKPPSRTASPKLSPARSSTPVLKTEKQPSKKSTPLSKTSRATTPTASPARSLTPVHKDEKQALKTSNSVLKTPRSCTPMSNKTEKQPPKTSAPILQITTPPPRAASLSQRIAIPVPKAKSMKTSKAKPAKKASAKNQKAALKSKNFRESTPFEDFKLDLDNNDIEKDTASSNDDMDTTPLIKLREEKISLDISISSDTSNENDIPLAKLVALSKEKSSQTEEDEKQKLQSDQKELSTEKFPIKATNNKKKTPAKKSQMSLTQNKSRTKSQKAKEQDEVIMNEKNHELLTVEKDVKEQEGKTEISIENEKADIIEEIKPEVYQETIKVEKEKIVDEKPKKLMENKSEKIKLGDSVGAKEKVKLQKLEVFNMNEDSFFNDDNDADEKINDLVNNIINSSELVDSETEKSEHVQNNVNRSQTEEAKCLICKRSFRNDKVLEKHNKTTTHLFKVRRREKRIADQKERQLKKEKEKSKDIDKEKQIENQVNILLADETKIFRTKGALKTFENILAYPSNDISDPYDHTKEFEPTIVTTPEHKTLFESNNKINNFDDDDDDDKNEDLSRKDKIFDSLFSNIENKLQAAQAASAANATQPLQKFAFPTLTPHDSELESSSTSWDLKHDADIEWDNNDNNDNNPPTLANVMKEKYPKKSSVKINKSKETAISIPTKSLIMGKIFKKHRDREKQKTPQADAPNNKPGIKNSLDEIFDHLKNTAEIDDKVLTCPSPKTLLKSSGGTFSPHSTHSNDMLETANSNNVNNIVLSKKPIHKSTADKSSAASSSKENKNNNKEIDELPKSNNNNNRKNNTKSIVVAAADDDEDEEDGIGKRKSRRRCAIKTKTFAETWSSDEYEELHDTNDIISIINEIEKRESSKKRKVSKSESHFVDNNACSKKSDNLDAPTTATSDYTQNHKTSTSILKSSNESTVNDKKSIQNNEKSEKKKSVQLQFRPSDIFNKEKLVNTIRKRRMSTLKDGHKSDEETFTATKDLKPLKQQTMSMMKKRRMSCFVPSSIFNDNPKPQTNNRAIKNSTVDVLSSKAKIDKEIDRKDSILNEVFEKPGKNQKKILGAVCNNSNSQATNASTIATSSTTLGTSKKKAQKHRKRPRNKIKNIAYDSDSDFELNLSRKSKASAFSDSFSEEEEDDKEETTHTNKVTVTSQNSLTKNSNTNESTMIKEPKLLPNDLNVVSTTTPAKAAIPEEDINDPMQSACNRTKRHSSEKLYYWSSSSESDVEPGDTADGENEDSMIPQQPEQHGWIVGDSHKKLVTLLAHAKIKNKIN